MLLTNQNEETRGSLRPKQYFTKTPNASGLTGFLYNPQFVWMFMILVEHQQNKEMMTSPHNENIQMIQSFIRSKTLMETL